MEISDPPDNGNGNGNEIEFNEELREAWLEEKRQSEFEVVPRSAMMTSNGLFFSTRRATQSDVISIITTSLPVSWSDNSWGNLHHGRPEVDSLDMHAASSKGRKKLDQIQMIPGHGGVKCRKKRTKQNRKKGKCLKSLDQVNVAQMSNVMNNPLNLTWKANASADRSKVHMSLLKERNSFIARLNQMREARYKTELDASVLLQRVCRGWLMRRWLKRNRTKIRVKKKVQMSYKVIQKQIQMKLQADENTKRLEQQRGQSIIVIQCAWRVFLSLRTTAKERKVRDLGKLIDAATRIQSVIRGKMARRTLNLMRLRFREEIVHYSSILIQSIWRAFIARQRVTSLRYALRRLCSSILCRWWRRVLSEKTVAIERFRREEERMDRAAIMMQRVFRGMKDRKDMSGTRDNASALLKDASALFLQRVFRGHVGRQRSRYKQFAKSSITRLCAAINIQRIMRGHLGRARFAKRSSMEANNIFYQIRIGKKRQVVNLWEHRDTHKITTETTGERGDSLLGVACKFGQMEICKLCVKWGCNLNHENIDGHTPLLLAIKYGHGELAEYLIGQKASVAKGGPTVLHHACFQGLENVVATLLHKKVSALERDPYTLNTAMHAAVLGACVQDFSVRKSKKLLLHQHRPVVKERHCIQILDRLLQAHVQLNAVNYEGQTCLHIAAYHGLFSVVQALIGMGIDCNIKDKKKRTAWRCAELMRYNTVSRLLLASCNISEDGYVETMSEEDLLALKSGLLNVARENYLDAKLDIIEKDLITCFEQGIGINSIADVDSGETFLMFTCHNGARKTFRLILKLLNSNIANQADRDGVLNAVDLRGRNAVHCSIDSSEAQAIWIAKDLVANGGDLFREDYQKTTPIHLAAMHETLTPWMVSSIQSNLEYDINNSVDNDGNTPLHKAAQSLSASSMTSLIKDLGADPSLRNMDGDSALHLILKHKSYHKKRDRQHEQSMRNNTLEEQQAMECIQLLLANDAEIALANNLGETPLHLAADHDRVGIVTLLLDQPQAQDGTFINARDNTGQTALIRAVEWHANNVISILVNHDKVDKQIQNHKGLSALEIAKSGTTSQNLAIVNMLTGV